jgi:hypothetical protein
MAVVEWQQFRLQLEILCESQSKFGLWPKKRVHWPKKVNTFGQFLTDWPK